MLATGRRHQAFSFALFLGTLVGILWAGAQFHVHKPGWHTTNECLLCDLEKAVSSGTVPVHAFDVSHDPVPVEAAIVLAAKPRVADLPAFLSRAPPRLI